MTINAIPRTALLLGWAGVLPFATLALTTHLLDPEMATTAYGWIIGYGGIILAFMSGVQWGIAMLSPSANTTEPEPVDQMRLAISVVPALMGFAALIAPSPFNLWLLIGGFIGLLAYDLATVKAGLAPAWYRALRLQLSAAVIACLVVSGLS